MNPHIPGHPRFEKFLKSDVETQMSYSGVLNGVKAARNFQACEMVIRSL